MAFHRASSSSSSFIPRWDVFLSFRGEDTRRTFTAHLCATLRQKGIHTFMDDKLRSGKEISQALIQAIEESEISIIVLSKNYASSRWCLDELIKILECRKTKGQQVLPLFYDVDPSEVRNQTNGVGEAFVKHKERFKDDVMKVKGWKTALTEVANLSGKHLENGNEPGFIQEIIEWVNSILIKKTYFQVAKYPVGIESRVQVVKSLLDIKKNDSTCMVGIFGTGGIGKTTLAKAIYNSIASKFEGSCFLGNIRETSGQMGGLMSLQNKLLSNILGGGSSLTVDNVDQGVTLIEKRLRSLRVLLVLDDVDKLDQLEKLAGNAYWFGLGSRVIITTRDKDLLRAHGVGSAFQVNELDDKEALQFFSWNAFKSDKPNDDFLELTEDVIGYARGLPLALVVLGSDLFGKGLHEWKSALDRYKRIPNKALHEILRISYDGLEDTVKDIFLDIACFFKGKEVGYVKKILDKGDFFPDFGIKVLVDKSLISISEYDVLTMHDLLQEVGREIVRQESRHPGKRSRLWFHEDVRCVLEGNTNFPNMTIMDFSHCEFIRKISDVSRIPNLEKLYLDDCKNLVEVHPSVGYLDKLVSLSLERCSNLRSFPKRLKMRSLKFLFLSGCLRLKNFPEIECQMECLEDITLSETSIEELSSSIGYLIGVKTLSLSRCTNLVNLLHSIHKFQHLESLLFQDINMDMIIISCLGLLDSNYQLRHLKHLHLNGCSKVTEFLKTVEDTRQSMPVVVSTEESLISSVPELLQLSPPTNTTNSNDGCSSILLSKLPTLNLKKCALSKSNFFRTFDCCSTLTQLDLSRSDIVTLPPCIRRFVRLKSLRLIACKQLKEILGLPPNVQLVDASRCVSLAIFLEEGRRSQLFNTPEALFQVGTVFPELILGKPGHTESDFLIQRDCPSSLTDLNLSGSDIVILPAWLNKFVGLEYLRMHGCKQLEEIPELPSTLKWINLSDCHGLRDNMGDALQIRLMSEGHAKDHEFGCIFPRNKIPDCFSHRKEVSNANSCEIDINESLHLDSVNTRFVFSAVFGTKDVQVSDYRQFHAEVLNNGQCICSRWSDHISNLPGSDNVWLDYRRVKFSHHSQLKTDNLRVKFTCLDEDDNPSESVFLKSCGFHVEHRYEEECQN